MDTLGDIITYVRRIIKSPSNAQITDALIIDYINRFWIMDVDARIQLFDLKTKYQFQTVPGFDQYNVPLYAIQTEPGNQNINYYPVYQGFLQPAYVNGVQVILQTEKTLFFNTYPNIVQNLTVVGTGNGSSGPYTLQLPIEPANYTPVNPPLSYLLRGHVDNTGVIYNADNGGTFQDPIQSNQPNVAIPTSSIFPAVYLTSIASDGSSIMVCDSGQFLTNNLNLGMLVAPNSNSGNLGFPTGYENLANGYNTSQNVINYFSGVISNVYFPQAVPDGAQINAQVYFFQTGLPRTILINNNVLTLRSPPDRQYLVEIDAYLTPAAFLSSAQSIQFAYMSEYIARGAARKILSDTGDVEQFQFYEPLFREQEILVWKRSQRQFTSTRSQTIYSQGLNQNQAGINLGGNTL